MHHRLLATVAFLLAIQVEARADDQARAPLPDRIVGHYSGQASQTIRTKDRCKVTSRKLVSLEIESTGDAHWNGHHFFDIQCPEDAGQRVPRSCWTEGSATVAAVRGGKYSLLMTSTKTSAAPAIYDATLARWRCGSASFALPSNAKPLVKVGPIEDESLEALAVAQCSVGNDFDELAAT